MKLSFPGTALLAVSFFSVVSNASPVNSAEFSGITPLPNIFESDPATCIPNGGACPPKNPKACCSCQCLLSWWSGYICGSGNECDPYEASVEASLEESLVVDTIGGKQERAADDEAITSVKTIDVTSALNASIGTPDACIPNWHDCPANDPGWCCSGNCEYRPLHGFQCWPKTFEADPQVGSRAIVEDTTDTATESTDLAVAVDASTDTAGICISPGFACSPDKANKCCSCSCLFNSLRGYVCTGKGLCTVDISPPQERSIVAEGTVPVVESHLDTKSTIVEDSSVEVDAKGVSAEDASDGKPKCIPDRQTCTPIGDGHCCSKHCMYTMWYGYICGDS